ncbi:hypothetical protein OG209_17995 [Streptomyces sp. NBC_01383]|uniref:hypothetical protein n=1 Tax=Streptomyces sp. NBC_01383 TaxID=2903846 RepID=UPI0032512FA5
MTITTTAPAAVDGAAPGVLRSRPGLHCAPVPSGVYFSGTRGQFVLRGSDVLYALAEGCLPLLEAGTTLDALVTAIGTERARPAVVHIVGRLRANGLLLDSAVFTAPQPPAAVRERYADSLARLESRLDDPYAAFARLHATAVELRGPGTATAPAERGLRRAGVRRVTAVGAPAPSARAPHTSVGDPAAYETHDPIPAGDPAVHGTDAPIPAGGPAVRVMGDLIPAGGPAVREAYDLIPAGDPAARPSPSTRTAIRFLTGDETWPGPTGTFDVPVLLGPGLTLVGPVGATPATWAAFRDRALSWAAAEGAGPAPGPVAHALAGALAAQLLADTLTGVAEPGEAHVVHGDDLTADRVTVTGAPVTEAAALTLHEAPVRPFPEAEAALASAGELATRWTGLFASAEGEDLPQMPLALRAAEHRAAPRTGGSVTAWAAHQETVTLAAALAALRDRGSRSPGSAAAGLTEEHWLLDGALRQIAASTTGFSESDATAHPLTAESERVLSELRVEDARFSPQIAVAPSPETGWYLARVTAGGDRLGAGWGPTPAEATHAALCTALAAAQARLTGSGTVVDPLSTDALLSTGDAARAALRARLTAPAPGTDRTATAYRGRASRTDPVLGDIPFWYGPVEAVARTAQEQENHDAD